MLTLLVVHGLAFRWRRFLARQSFLVVWLVFCAFAAGAAALGWMLHGLLAWRLPPAAPGLHQALLAAGLYPILAWCSAGCTGHAPGGARHDGGGHRRGGRP